MAVDLELKRAFADLQAKMVSTKQLLASHDVQIAHIKKEIDTTKITGSALTSLPPSTKAYESVGRMFVKQDVPVIHKHLDQEVEGMNERISERETREKRRQRSKQVLLSLDCYPSVYSNCSWDLLPCLLWDKTQDHLKC